MGRSGFSDVLVIIPTLNEEEGLGPTLRELKSVLGDPFILVVDGNSVNGTVKIAKELGVEVMLQNGRGKGAALRQAFEYDGFDGDFVVTIDADGSMDPKEVPLFIEALESGADVVKGSRFLPNSHSQDITLVRKIGNSILVSLINFIWAANYTDLCYGFMGFRREALKKLSSRLGSNKFEIETEISIKAKKLGLRVAEVPSIELRRRYGRSHLCTFRDGFRIFRKIMRELFEVG